MRMGMFESFIIVFPRLMLFAIVVLLVVIVIKMFNKKKDNTGTNAPAEKPVNKAEANTTDSTASNTATVNNENPKD